MLKALVNFLFTTIIALTLQACSEPVKLQPLASNASILAFGDSLTYGTGTSRDKAYPAVLQQLVNRTVINAGVPGEISQKGLSRLPALLKKHQPSLIIICHGGNDILRKLDLAKTRDNIQQMINLARQNNTEVVLIGVPEFGLFLDTVAMYPTLAEKNQLPISQHIIGDIIGNAGLKSDHIHPNAKGYQLLAENIQRLLKTSGAL